MTREPKAGDTCTRCGERVRPVRVDVSDASSRLNKSIEQFGCDCFAGPVVAHGEPD